MLRLLKERGYVSYIQNKARSITVLPASRQMPNPLQPRRGERLAA